MVNAFLFRFDLIRFRKYCIIPFPSEVDNNFKTDNNVWKCVESKMWRLEKNLISNFANKSYRLRDLTKINHVSPPPPLCRGPGAPCTPAIPRTFWIDPRRPGCSPEVLVGISESGSHFKQFENTKLFLDMSTACIDGEKLQYESHIWQIHFIGLATRPGIHRMEKLNPILPTVAFSQLSSNMCCPRDCVSRHNGGT